MGFYGRQNELKWLKRAMKMDHRVLVSGLKGVGKSHLVRHFLQSSSLNFEWYSVDPNADLFMVLGTPKNNMEESFKAASENWNFVDVVVWSKAHNLNKDQKNYILGQLSNHSSNVVHIFLSDAEMFPSSHLDFPHLKLSPFTSEETAEYILSIDDEIEPTELEEIHRYTGGLPLYIKLYLQNGSTEDVFKSHSFSDLSVKTRTVFQFCALLNRSLTKSELEAFDANSGQSIEDLKEKFLIELGPNGSVSVPDSVRSLYLKSLSTVEKTDLYNWILTNKNIWDRNDLVERLTYSLLAQNKKFTELVLAELPFEKLNSLSKNHLNELYEAAEAISTDRERGESIQLLRLRMRLIYLLGDRTKSVEIGFEKAEDLSKKAKPSIEEQALIYELIRCLNRLQRHKEALEICERMNGLGNSSFGPLFLIELGSALGSKEYEKAMQAFTRAVDMTKGSDDPESVKACALAQFEMARIEDWKQNFVNAADLYESALNYFTKTDYHHFKLICCLNLSWVHLKTMSWDKFRKSQEKLFSMAKNYGNNYVLAGTHLIQASYHYHFIESGQAITHVNECRKLLGDSAPLEAKFDLGINEFNIYLQMGLRGLAKSVLDKLKGLITEDSPYRMHRRYGILKLRFECGETGRENYIENWNSFWKDEEIQHKYLYEILQLADFQLSEEQETTLSKYPLGQLKLAEMNLLNSISTDVENVWKPVGKIETLVHKTTDPMPEKVALQLLYFHLQKGTRSDFSYIENAKIELHRWGADSELKRPLLAWIDAIERNTTPEHSPEWKMALQGDQERWAKWFRPFFKKESAKFTEISNHGRKEIESPEVSLDGVYVRADLGEVMVNGELANAFLRRHHLQKLIVGLMESYPMTLDKGAIASLVWGEAYDPTVHDARIYTSVQRIRKLLGNVPSIQSWDNGYRWDPRSEFILVKSNAQNQAKLKRTQRLILQELESRFGNGEQWVSRSQLKEVANCSDATLKRELSQLLSQNKVQRRGRGRAIVYSI